jgi:hypothetical protein
VLAFVQVNGKELEQKQKLEEWKQHFTEAVRAGADARGLKLISLGYQDWRVRTCTSNCISCSYRCRFKKIAEV